MNQNFVEPFRFDRYPWPPPGRITSNRFLTNFKPLGGGTFRICYLGEDRFTSQPIVIKRLRQHHPMEESYWKDDIYLSRVAQQFADRFNAIMQTSKSIRFIQPIIDEWKPRGHAPLRRGEKALVEPYLGANYEKFNSNTGEEYRNHGLSMGAFSHFTYHISGGRMLVCDLQGVRTRDKYILTDPVICSLEQTYGVTDTGEAGIRSFFYFHRCTDLCESTWRKHPSPKRHPAVTPKTTYLV